MQVRVGAVESSGAVGYQAAELMQNIVREIKEIPELPSENPGNDSAHLTKVLAPDEGGLLTFMENEAEPYRGFPFFEMVDRIDLMKKVFRGALSSMFHSLKKRNRLTILTLIFVPWLLKDSAKAGVYAFYRIVMRFRIKPKYYSEPMRELYRALSVRGSYTDEQYELLTQVRDLVCMILEMDNAYRYRLQDVIVELDKDALRKKPAKELVRLLHLLKEREQGQDVADTWTLIETFLPAFLFLNRKVKRAVIAVLTELDLEKMALSKEDKWYAAPRKDYICGFRTKPTEEDKEILRKVQLNTKKKDARVAIREESTKAHEELFKRQAEEMAVSPEIDALVRKDVEELELALQNETNRVHGEEKQKIIKKYLTKEQLDILARHNEETNTMNNAFNERLIAVDNLTE